jgi:Flp pilus assembly protein CpaB
LRRSSRLVLLLGAFLAVLTFVVVLLISSSGGGGGTAAQPTPPTELATVVAAADIPLGTVVTGDMLESKKLAVAARDGDALGDVSQAIGKIARKPIPAGAQVHVSDFATAQAQLAVPAGKRAFALQVDETTGVGNLVYAGDYIDVVISLGDKALPLVKHVVEGNNINPNLLELIASGGGTATEPFHAGAAVSGFSPLTVKASMLLQEIQVLGTIDSPPSGPTGPAAQPGTSPAPTGPTLNGNPRLVILAVTDAQAEALIYARTVGKLDLVLRSPDDKGTTETTTGVVLRTILDTFGVLPPYPLTNVDAFVVVNP